MQETIESARFSNTIAVRESVQPRYPHRPQRLLLRLFVAASMFLTGPNGPLTAGAQSVEASPTLDTYDRVVQLVFGNPQCDPARATDYSYSVLLRFLPTEGPESQVLICSLRKGGYQVTYQITPENIWHSVLEAHRWTGREDPQEIAAKIKTATLEVEVNQAQMHRLMGSYSRLRLSPLFDTAVSVDGGGYELWFASASNKVHYSLSGSLDGVSPKDSPLIRWMAEVRHFVDQSQLPGPKTPHRRPAAAAGGPLIGGARSSTHNQP